jgi:hypothetical protein
MGETAEAQRVLLSGGADRVATSLLQARDEIINVGRLLTGSNGAPSKPA